MKKKKPKIWTILISTPKEDMFEVSAPTLSDAVAKIRVAIGILKPSHGKINIVINGRKKDKKKARKKRVWCE